MLVVQGFICYNKVNKVMAWPDFYFNRFVCYVGAFRGLSQEFMQEVMVVWNRVAIANVGKILKIWYILKF